MAVELGRYRTRHGERVLVGQRILGVVRITDIPAAGRGRRYLVECEFTAKVELDAIVDDYLERATTGLPDALLPRLGGGGQGRRWPKRCQRVGVLHQAARGEEAIGDPLPRALRHPRGDRRGRENR